MEKSGTAVSDGRQFIPIVHFESWLNRGKNSFPKRVDGPGEPARGESRGLTAVPAYKMVRVKDGKDDPEGLVGTVKTRQELDHLHPDIFQDTVRIGGTTYFTELGYIAQEKNGKPDYSTAGTNGACRYCPSLRVERTAQGVVFRCLRHYRVIYAEFAGRFDSEHNAPLFSLSRYCPSAV